MATKKSEVNINLCHILKNKKTINVNQSEGTIITNNNSFCIKDNGFLILNLDIRIKHTIKSTLINTGGSNYMDLIINPYGFYPYENNEWLDIGSINYNVKETYKRLSNNVDLMPIDDDQYDTFDWFNFIILKFSGGYLYYKLIVNPSYAERMVTSADSFIGKVFNIAIKDTFILPLP